MIELKMTRMKEYAIWEERQKPRTNFILTKAKPHICYLPRRLHDTAKALLDTCKGDVTSMCILIVNFLMQLFIFVDIIEKRREEIFMELQHIEERMKKNFEPKKAKDSLPEEKQHDEAARVEMECEEATFNTEVLHSSKTVVGISEIQPQIDIISESINNANYLIKTDNVDKLYLDNINANVDNHEEHLPVASEDQKLLEYESRNGKKDESD